MKCVSCGTRAEPKDGTFTCTFCGYTQPLPKTWQLIGHSPTVTTYTPSVVELTEEELNPVHPRTLPPDHPRHIAWRQQVSASKTGTSYEKRGAA